MIELNGPFAVSNCIVHGSTAFDPVSRIRTSVSESFYGGSGDVVSYTIRVNFDEGMTEDNIRRVDPESGRATYRTMISGQQPLCKFSLKGRDNEGHLDLTLKTSLTPDQIIFPNFLKTAVSEPAAVLRYILSTAHFLFGQLAKERGFAGASLYLPSGVARLIGHPPSELTGETLVIRFDPQGDV